MGGQNPAPPVQPIKATFNKGGRGSFYTNAQLVDLGVQDFVHPQYDSRNAPLASTSRALPTATRNGLAPRWSISMETPPRTSKDPGGHGFRIVGGVGWQWLASTPCPKQIDLLTFVHLLVYVGVAQNYTGGVTQVLVHVSTSQGKPFWHRLLEPQPCVKVPKGDHLLFPAVGKVGSTWLSGWTAGSREGRFPAKLRPCVNSLRNRTPADVFGLPFHCPNGVMLTPD